MSNTSSCRKPANKVNLTEQLSILDDEQLINNPNVQSKFDILAKLCLSPLVENSVVVSKLLKMFDSVQTYFDTQNQYLSDYYAKCRENHIIQLGKNSSELKHRTELQNILLSALNENDLNKAALINSILNQSSFIPISNNSNSNSPTLPATASSFNNFILDNFATSRNFLGETRATTSHNHHHNHNHQSNHDTSQVDSDETINESNLDENGFENLNNERHNVNGINSGCSSELADMDMSVKFSLKENANESNSIFSLNDSRTKIRYTPLSPVRHLICSPGLEATAHRYKIIILYRGICNGHCYQNKPWSNQVNVGVNLKKFGGGGACLLLLIGIRITTYYSYLINIKWP